MVRSETPLTLYRGCDSFPRAPRVVRVEMKVCCAVLLLMSLAVPSMRSQTVAATPPMGWNSWDAYGLTITEDQFRANVKVLTTQLKPAGYQYAVIDEGWFFFNPEDRPHPDTLHY